MLAGCSTTRTLCRGRPLCGEGSLEDAAPNPASRCQLHSGDAGTGDVEEPTAAAACLARCFQQRWGKEGAGPSSPSLQPTWGLLQNQPSSPLTLPSLGERKQTQT